jgi:RHS repeat-associated protein
MAERAGKDVVVRKAFRQYLESSRESLLVAERCLLNTLGQMAQTSNGAAGTALYMYDEAGHLLGEYSSTGALIEETVWLGDIPVATLRPNGSSVAVYYIEADHLNTPRQVTRPSDNKQMWTWFSDPFGTTAANSNPAGAGTFTYNLRFPGQIYDPQAGLHQNYFRDYDPAVGRYTESDPIGLNGGSYSTYRYVSNDPVMLVDPLGQYDVKGGVPAPSSAIDALLTCIQGCYGQSFTVTSTTDSHSATSPHGQGVAADIRYPSDPSKFLCCAGKCGAGFAQDEKLNPSAHATAPHIHIQLPAGTHGGRGDLPSSYTSCSPSGCAK